jgi:hypothetical protein
MEHRSLIDLKPFQPLIEVVGMLSSLYIPWYVAGGWAIDLYVQQYRRKHKDIDIAIFRRDQLVVQGYFLERGWKLWKYVGNSTAREPWLPGERLELPDRGIFVEPVDEIPSIDILLSEIEGDEWYYHKDSRIRHPVRSVGMRSTLEIPLLSPEIVLLFKARHVYGDEPNDILNRQKDENDFQAVHRFLTAKRRAWLAQVIELLYPNHPWLKYL